MHKWMRVLFLGLLISQPAMAKDQIIMRLHGSNTIGAELGPELVKAWMQAEGYSQIQQQQLAEEEQLITGVNAEGYAHSVEIKSHGSTTGFKSIAQADADIAMSSRPIKLKEKDELSFLGDMTRFDAEYVIGLDGIAVIVNKANTLEFLEKDVIRQIFTGEINDWSQLDAGLSGEIHVYARDDKSGTYDTFKALVLGKESALIGNAQRYESNAHLSDDVAKDPLAIGFVGLPYVRDSKSIAVAEKGALPKVPEAFEVATEDYALSRRLYMYVPSIHDQMYVKSFIDFCLRESGQHIVHNTGFVSQNIMARSITPNPGFPEEYLVFTENGERLSLNIRFHKDSTRLDNKALKDVERLVHFMKLPDNKKRKVMLFGFSDENRTLPEFGLDLSTYRVDRVSDLLVQYGIGPVRVRSYGGAIPVASNEDAGGRHKNRRVEVWLQ